MSPPALRTGIVAVVASAAGVAALEGAECPRIPDPYSGEANAFGWPLTPAEFEFGMPRCWAEKYPLCSGEHQSPLALDLRLDDADCALHVDGVPGALADKASYKPLSGKPIVSVSKYMRAIHLQGDFGTLALKDASGQDVAYKATDAYLTADSLHEFNGTLAEAELLVVHRPAAAADALGGSVVLSLRFKEGPRASPLVAQMGLPSMGAPTFEGNMWQASESIDLAAALRAPLRGNFYTYAGSVPVPPCTENVHYIVLDTVESITPHQVQMIKDTLVKQAGGFRKRKPVHRMESGKFCRKVAANSLALSTAQTDCSAATRSAAACWEQRCDLSPIDIHSKSAAVMGAQATTPSFMYRPAGHATVAPTDFALEATGDFGGALIDGRLFEARKLSIKAVSQHAVDGERHAAELVVHHSLYGEALNASGHRRLETEVHASQAGHGDAYNHAHEVMVSIPLRLGKESPLLRALGMGDAVRKAAIRDGNSYDMHGPIDLGAAMAGSTKGWFWYSGGPTTPGSCPAWGVKWIVMREPLQASLEQLNSLVLKVSGMDSTMMPQRRVDAAVVSGSVPRGAVEEGGWHGPSAACESGTQQSPVHIKTDTVALTGSDNFLAKASWKPVSGLRLENVDGSLAFRTRQMGYFTLTGANGFPKYYQVTSVNLKMPSEHMVDGRQFPAELQVVHKNQKTVLELQETDSLVASFLFEFGEASKLLAQMLPAELPAPGKHVSVGQPVDLMWALGPAMDGKFYTYEGSHTSGSCTEGAKWAVFNKTMTLSMEQFQAFKAAFPGSNVNRPVQPLNGRQLSQNLFEQGEPVDYRYFLNRGMGRDKSETPIAYIAFPIAGTLLLCSVMMTAIFQREDRLRKGESAGGLTHQTGVSASTIGKGYRKI